MILPLESIQWPRSTLRKTNKAGVVVFEEVADGNFSVVSTHHPSRSTVLYQLPKIPKSTGLFSKPSTASKKNDPPNVSALKEATRSVPDIVPNRIAKTHRHFNVLLFVKPSVLALDFFHNGLKFRIFIDKFEARQTRQIG
jgi:hypothetical protein